MDLESVFTDSKWNILAELSHGSLSPTELANKTGTSVANISTQIRLLEALDFIEKEKLNNVGKGEPRKLFSLKKEFCYLILGTKFAVGKKMIRLDDENMPFFTSLMINDPMVSYIIMKLFLDHENIIKESLAIGYVSCKNEEVEILLISQTPSSFYHLNEKHIIRNNRTFKIKAHVHTKEALQSGINNKEEYFISLIKKVYILLDKENILAKLKKGGK